MFTLAASAPPEGGLPPSLAYWRELAGRYLAALCRTPEGGDSRLSPVPPPTPGETAAFLLRAPPMEGGEYLGAELLEEAWGDLDRWVRREVAASGSPLSDWLQEHAPLWHQVGRVCLHLAENKRDPEYPFAFLATYAPRLSQAGRVQYQPLSRALQEYAGARNKGALVRLLSPVQRAAEESPLIRELVASGDLFHPLAWTPAEAYAFLQQVALLEASGVLVRLPDWWRRRPRPRVGVSLNTKKGSALGMEGLLEFRVRLALGDEALSDAEWESLARGQDGLVLLKGQWVEVDRARLAEALAHWKRVEAEVAAGGGISFAQGMRLLAGAPAELEGAAAALEQTREWSSVEAGDRLAGLLEGLRDPARLGHPRPSEGLRATLRPYQEQGVAWLHLLARLGLGGCLADDMGLGKTLQALALLLILKQEDGAGAGPSLLVLPASLLANWRSELDRFTPSLRAVFVHPSETGKDALEALAADPAGALAGVDLVVTTYGMLLRQPWLHEVSWRLAILDEAQAIKNPGSRQARAVKALKARSRLALTGTPVENRAGDLWSLFDFLCPGLLGSAKRFKGFVQELERREEGGYEPLRRLVTPYILRRLKTEKRIIADLPEKTEVKVYCGLARPQAALYARAVGELRTALAQEDTSAIQRRGLVLAYLLRFKQICNHPSQLLGDGAYDPEQSGKFERLGALGEEIASRQEKALVFTQFREMTGPLAAFLAPVFGREGLVLHGGTPVGARRALVEAFQDEAGPPFFVVSLKAGGTGLNLTAASHVVHFDRWWNPAVENQATDRAFRIGQRRNVLVHKFVCRGTVEEKIDALIEEKTALAGGLLEGGGETLLTELSDAELVKLVALDIDRASL
ncbi:MAG: DEAD/DEAH box helicase [Thermodesulfobacteriota bacterium]